MATARAGLWTGRLMDTDTRGRLWILTGRLTDTRRVRGQLTWRGRVTTRALTRWRLRGRPSTTGASTDLCDHEAGIKEIIYKLYQFDSSLEYSFEHTSA